MRQRNWKYVDIIIVTGDAYVDHPSFGVALIARLLESQGFKVAVLAQPDWRNADAFRVFGPPRLFWSVTSGAIDSRLNDYASLGNKRSRDVYSPGGRKGLRPTRPLTAYTARIREAYKGIPIIIGGLEASLRRMVHYDYIEDRLKRSVLIDSKADMLIYGMAETAITNVAKQLASGTSIYEITDTPGTAWPATKGRTIPKDALYLPSRQEIEQQPELFMNAYLLYYRQCTPDGRAIAQHQGPVTIVLQPPAAPLTTKELDKIYTLPFTRQAAPQYKRYGGVPALQSVQNSITTHRGCFGGCSFCSIYNHQSKYISSRSIDSIMNEIYHISSCPSFHGTITDIGGPTANMYGMGCNRKETCTRPSCLAPTPCRHIKDINHSQNIKLLETILKWASGNTKTHTRYQNRSGNSNTNNNSNSNANNTNNNKTKNKHRKSVNVYIASGVRYDLAMHSPEYMKLLIEHFTGGHLKVAPEHYCKDVLTLMNKPPFDTFERFERTFYDLSKQAGKQQYLVPYFISAHPGCTLNHACELYLFLKKRRWKLQQVQDFTPIPLTLSTAMYVSETNEKGQKIYVAKGRRAKREQLALMQYHLPANKKLVQQLTRK